MKFPTLRPAVISRIERQLNDTVFGKHLFTMSANDPPELLDIYLNSQGARFSLSIDSDLYEQYADATEDENDPPLKFLIWEKPGEFSNEGEYYETDNLSQAVARVGVWIYRLEEDLLSDRETHEWSPLDSLRSSLLNELKNAEIDNDTSGFSLAEREEYDRKLDSWEIRFEELYKERDATNKQIKEMRAEIAKLRRAVHVLDKRTWFSAAINRVLDIVQEVRGAKQEVEQILGPVIDYLPSLAEEVKADE